MEEHHAIRVRHAARSPLGAISVAGFIRHSQGLPAHPLRTLGSYALVYVIDGGGRYRDASGLTRSVRAGDLLLVFPDLPHTYGPEAGGHWTEWYVVFGGPVFDLWRRSGLLDPTEPVRHLEPVEAWSHRFATLLGEPAGGNGEVGSPLLEVCRLQELLGAALTDAGDRGEEAAWLARAKALLEADLELGRERGDRQRITQVAGAQVLLLATVVGTEARVSQPGQEPADEGSRPGAGRAATDGQLGHETLGREETVQPRGRGGVR